MPRSKPQIPAHTEVVYDVCDILDELATTDAGRAQAYAIATKAAALVIDAYPQLAERKIGAPLVARYKSASAQATAHRYKSREEAEDARTASIFDDAGRPLIRRLYDKHGRPLP